MELKERQEKEAEEYSRLLKKVFPEPEQGIKILNICCGTISEEDALYKHFSPAKLVSIDCSEVMERWAKKLGRKSFVKADLSALEHVLTEKFELLLGRNIPLNPGGFGRCPGSALCYIPEFLMPGLGKPLPVEKNDKWLDIFKKIKSFMNNDSEFFITLLRDDEYLRALNLLPSAGYIICEKYENPNPTSSDSIGVAVDYKDTYIIKGRI